MNVWEETWEPTPTGVDVLTQKREYVATFASDMLTPAETERARACLGAAAPEMYRLLVEAEWGNGGACPWCSGRGEHGAGCRWVAAIKKARRP